MNYQVYIEKRVLKSLAKIQEEDREKILKNITSLENNPRPAGSKKLTGRDGWRIRIGNYRVIYEINDKISRVLIVEVGHRKDIYR